MRKILVIDTQGEAISAKYRALLPGIQLRGVEMDSTRGTPCHEHGGFCGWLAAIPAIASGVEFELVFARIFDKDAKWLSGCEDWMLEIIAAEKPNYISRSWGAWDGDDKMQSLYGQVAFQEFVPAFLKLQAEIGFVDFGAAGNSDANDSDEDVDFPQSQMLDTCNIIGASRRDGVPTEWSGDGTGVQCVMWADLVYSPDMAGVWRLWSGTSAATPKACGACAALGDDLPRWRQRMEQLPPGCRPTGDWTIPHPKWGYGCAEDLWQNFARRTPPGLMPPASPVATKGGPVIRPEFFDYKKVDRNEEARGSDPVDRRPGRAPQSEPSAGSRSVRRGKETRAEGADRRA